ncbi:MAG: PAS domain S-box protein [Chitinivibrionales bacterium]|nr:PAS domain S-box protein [Chitinivibrionales bacterium]
MEKKDYKILVVDDEPQVCNLIAEALSDKGYSVETCGSGLKAWEKAEKEFFHLFIIDMMMPEMNGITLLKKLDIRNNIYEAIMITGNEDIENIENIKQSIQLGAFGYFNKPIQFVPLLLQITQALEVMDLKIERDRYLHRLEEKESAIKVMLEKETREHETDKESLRESENRYRILFECSHDALMTLEGPSWKFTSGNPACVELFGARDAAEFTSFGPWNLSPERQPDGSPSDAKAAEMIGRAMITGSHFFEWTHKKLTGETFPATVLLTRIVLEEKSFLLATVRDISLETKAREALAENEERYRVLFEDARDGIALADAQTGKIVNCNRALYGLVEREKNDLIGKHQSILHPPQELDQELTKTFIKHQKSDAGLILEEKLISKSGKTIPVEIRGARVRMKGHEYILGIFRDITERKHAEEEHRVFQEVLEEKERLMDGIFTNMQEGILSIDNDYRIVYMNLCAQEITGISFGQYAGCDLLSAIDKFSYASRLLEIIKAGSATDSQSIISIPATSGNMTHYLVRISDFLGVAGQVVGRIINFIDQTSKVEADRMHDFFISSVAHELRTPITIIKNFLEIIRLKRMVTNDWTEIMAGLESASGRLIALIYNFSMLSSLSHSQYTGESRLVNITDLVKKGLDLIQAEAEEKKLAICVESLPGNGRVYGDPGLLGLVIFCLLSNAVKFSFRNGEITISIQRQKQAGKDSLNIRITDTGIGMSPEVQRNMFKGFRQGENPLTRHYGGVGVGLYLVKRALNILYGNISVESEEGKGSKFMLNIPLEEVPCTK